MIIIFYKAESEKQASEVVLHLLKARLSNSIDQVPLVKSFSWVDGKVKKDQEILLIIKTRALLYRKIEDKIKEVSNSNVPKMYSLPMTQVDEKYRELLTEEIEEV